MDQEQRLPPFAEDALAVLTEAIGDNDDGLPKAEAKTAIADDDRFSGSDADHALDMLSNRGRISSVNDRVRITSTDE
jgi:hypothetical protein